MGDRNWLDIKPSGLYLATHTDTYSVRICQNNSDNYFSYSPWIVCTYTTNAHLINIHLQLIAIKCIPHECAVIYMVNIEKI